jgi:acyl-CoA reductase-like NAD-dependent aldehyde dehydrogenase
MMHYNARTDDIALDMIVDGERTKAQSGDLLAVIDPATEKAFAAVPRANADDVDRAVRSARQAFDTGRWLALGNARRSQILWRIAELIDANIDELAALETRSLGMPFPLARAIAAQSANIFRYWAGWCTKIDGRISDISDQHRSVYAHVLPEPVGVCGLITAWNTGILVPANKLGPALAAGCSVVLKPAEDTPLSCLRLGEMMIDAGVPEGVVNVVTGYGYEAGAALTHHPLVDKISFTGSVGVGRAIVEASAATFKRVTLELGGKSPFIIFDDADIDRAIASAGTSIFLNTGQSCVAGSRLFVQRGVYEEVVTKLAKRARTIRVDEGFIDGAEMGPVVSDRQLSRVLGYIDSARSEGAEVVAGGKRIDRTGYFIEPTIFAGIRPEMKVVREEVFGPVLVIAPFDELEDVISRANATDFGLAAYIWTEDVRKAQNVAKRLKAGIIWVNTELLTDPAVPFGGFKQSGIGREGGVESIQAYLETKSVIYQEWPPRG